LSKLSRVGGGEKAGRAGIIAPRKGTKFPATFEDTKSHPLHSEWKKKLGGIQRKKRRRDSLANTERKGPLGNMKRKLTAGSVATKYERGEFSKTRGGKRGGEDA